MSTKEKLILDELSFLVSLEDVLGCMVAKKGLSGLAPVDQKISNLELWSILKKTTDEIFDLINKFYDYGLEDITFELGDYFIIIRPLSRMFSLIVIISTYSNRGIIDVEIENTVRRMQSIIGDKNQSN